MSMKKRKWMKKLTAVMLVAAMIAAMTGCGNSGSGSKAGEKDIKQLVYNAQPLAGGEQIQGDISSYCVNGDTIYVYSTEWIENKAPQPRDTQDAEGETKDAEGETQDAEGDTQDAEGETQDAEGDTQDAEGETQDAEGETQDAEGETQDTEGEAQDAEDETQGEDLDLTENVDGEEPIEEYSYTTNQYFYSVKADGSDFKELFSNLDCGDSNEWLSDFQVSDNGDLYMLYSSYDPQTESNTYLIRVLDSAGNQKSEFDLSSLLTGEESYFQTMKLDPNGNIYLLGDQTIFVTDAEGNKLFDVKMDSWASSMAMTSDGVIVVSTYGEEGMEIKEVDLAKKTFGATYKLGANIYNSNSLISGSGDYSLYYNDGSSIFGYDVKSGNSTELLNWVSSNMNSSFVNNMQAMPDGRFIVTYYDYSEGGDGEDSENGLYIMTKVDPSDVKDKKIITYAGMWVDDKIKSQAVKFNKSQDEYQIVVRDYSSSDDPQTDMNADLIAGNIPDIIDMSSMDIDKYIAKGMLTDLYTFMENDPDIKKEDFIDNVLKVLETDGKLYHISPTFSINGLVGRAKDMEGRDSFTLKDLQQLEQQYGNGAKAFHMRSNTSVLSNFCSSNYDRYIDWNSGKCSFDSDEFVALLEYANTYPNEDDINWDDGYESLPSSIRSGKVLFADVYSMSMEEIQLYSEMFQEDISIISYPSDSSTGLPAFFGTDIGIYSKSKNADGAWAFVKTFLTKDYICGGRYTYYSGFPLRKDGLENEIKKNSATEAYTDEYGNEIQPLDSTWGYDDIEVQIKPLTEEQVQKLREVIASVDHLYKYHDEINTIVMEESGAYFSGQKTAKEVAGIIQNRVSTYVNENR